MIPMLRGTSDGTTFLVRPLVSLLATNEFLAAQKFVIRDGEAVRFITNALHQV